jgi:hypothetical protein
MRCVTTLTVLLVLAMTGLTRAQTTQALQARSATTWRYTDRQSLTVNPLWEYYVDNVGFDMGGYARWKYGPTASAFNTSPGPYGWRIKYRAGNGQYYTVGINMLDVAYYTGVQKYGPWKMKNWGVYLNGNTWCSWKGAYINKL